MKYCYACGQVTGVEPFFCNFCGRSYDVKLCPRLHLNPRLAEACSQCGSRDLSIPQPRVPILWRLLAFLAQAIFGLLLLSLSIPLTAVLLNDLSRRSVPPARLLIGMFGLIVLWSLWVMLPDVSRSMIHRSLIQKSGSSDSRNSP